MRIVERFLLMLLVCVMVFFNRSFPVESAQLDEVHNFSLLAENRFVDNGDGTVTDNNTRLVWQKLDGGEMTYEKAVAYCDSLTLAGYTDWRLPTGIELFSINNHGKLNPAIDTAYFTQTLADYWWTSCRDIFLHDSSEA